MSIPVAFRFEQDDFVPYELPWASGQTWEDVLQKQGFRKEAGLALGRRHTGLRVEVYEAEDPTLPYQEFAFLAIVRIGKSGHPVFCRDLSELLHFLHKVTPIIELDLKCAGEAMALEAFAGIDD